MSDVPPDNKKRCGWTYGGNALSYHYHDTEWGVPVHDDQRHLEFLILEGAQAGLSWATVLNKRENYRRAFADFVPTQVARFSDRKIQSLLQDTGLIRNRLKMAAAVNNARCLLATAEEFGSFDAYLWDFVGGTPQQNQWSKMEDVPATSAVSDALSADLKKRGFKFVGSTIMYAYMQAVGMVNDHEITCFRHRPCAAWAD